MLPINLTILVLLLLLAVHGTVWGFVPVTSSSSSSIHWRSVGGSSTNGDDASKSLVRMGMFFAENVQPDKNDKDKECTSKISEDVANDSDMTSGKTTSVLEATETSAPPSLSTLPLQLVMDDSEAFLNYAGSFLVDSFWLSSDHHMLNDAAGITDEARMNLVVKQGADLQEKYGQLLGKRLARAAVIGALDEETNELVGMVTLKETLLLQNTELLESEKAEAIAKNAVASLGPKERRLYKNAPMATIATELLSPDTQAVCVLSNLAVSPKARRRGVANALCDEIEALAGDWEFNHVHLLVERDNAAARTLYERKMGYKEVSAKEAAPALRVDVATGAFVETTADTLILCKAL